MFGHPAYEALHFRLAKTSQNLWLSKPHLLLTSLPLPKSCWGPCTNDVSLIFGIFDPPLPLSEFIV